jgi:hypothetical protein
MPRWTRELLADESVKLIEPRQNLTRDGAPPLGKNEIKPWRKDMWCIPQVDGEFVAAWKMCSTPILKSPIRRAGGWF